MELQDLSIGNNPDSTPESSPSNVDSVPNQDASISNPSPPQSHYQSLCAWWNTQIALTLPDQAPHDPRDYLALERTFLGWIRTSTTIVSLGVVVTQLFVLKDVDPTKGKVLGCILTGAAIMIVVASAWRYFRMQRLLVRGKALTGGWEALTVWAVIGVVLGILFVVILIEV